jgi:predicted aspartyl protease
MGTRGVVCIALIMSAAMVAASARARPDSARLKALYEAHQWAELHDLLEGEEGPALYRGAVANAFNDVPDAERLLRSVLLANPGSPDADDAHELLSQIYLRTGRYRQLIEHIDARLLAFPNNTRAQGLRDEVAAFSGLPNQSGGRPRPASLRHDGSIFIPLSINGVPARYFFDTGAWVSCMTESEASRIGLRIRDTAGQLGTSTTAKTAFRTAVAPEVKIGNLHLTNVSFAVFPDTQEPWSAIALGERGIIGMPILLALRTLRWTKDGRVELSGASAPRRSRQSNLLFEGNHLIVTAGFEGATIRATLDTGAETTDIYGAFARQFPRAIPRQALKDSTEVRGIGHAESYDSVSVPELTFRLGGVDTALRPAHVILREMGPACCVANVGLDLLKQSHAFTIDFAAMRLTLEPGS